MAGLSRNHYGKICKQVWSYWHKLLQKCEFGQPVGRLHAVKSQLQNSSVHETRSNQAALRQDQVALVFATILLLLDLHNMQ